MIERGRLIHAFLLLFSGDIYRSPDHKSDFRPTHKINIQKIIIQVLKIGFGCIIYHWKALDVSYNIPKNTEVLFCLIGQKGFSF